MLIITFSGLLPTLGCLSHRHEPFTPSRPWMRPDLSESRMGRASEPFPERHLDEILAIDPPHALVRIEEIYRQVALLNGIEPEWRQAPVWAEVDSIRRAFEALDLGASSILRMRFGTPRPGEKEIFRRAANLQLRWGLALMRTGDVNQRIWGADRIHEAAAWDPESPVPVLVLAGYQEIGGFWSNERDLLDEWVRDHGPNDTVDLQRLRKRERLWKVERDPAALRAAIGIGREMAARHGGWEAAPAWLNLEHARMLLEADSLRACEGAARLALRDPENALASAQAELLLGVITVRRLEYERAEEHFRRAASIGATEPALDGLVAWLLVPWDLWTMDERAEFDRDVDRAGWIDRWWHDHDPILATPMIQEDRLEYLRRVGEAWFALEGIDLAVPGPLTDAGQVMLRYGRPDDWTSVGGETAYSEAFDPYNEYAVHRTWRFLYRLPERRPLPMLVMFQDNGMGSRFTALDSLKGPAWPPWIFHYGFEGRDYRLNTAPARLRRADGGLRLVICQDTWLPEYSVRYPLQGFRFDGEARARTAIYQPRKGELLLVREQEILLDQETVAPLEWTLRRRSGVQTLDLDGPGELRVATQLQLRDTAGRVAAMAVDNGRTFLVDPFAKDLLDASSLVLLSTLPDSIDDKLEWEQSPGHLVHGPDLLRDDLVPRAERYILPGEDFAFYLEVYNLDQRRGVTDAEMGISVEHLDRDGEMDYSVGIRGPSQTLIRYGVTQWNIARSLGLGNFDPGVYRLRIEIYDRKAERKLERTAEFRIATTDEIVERYGWDRLILPEVETDSVQTGSFRP